MSTEFLNILQTLAITVASGALAVVMGIRFKRSGKLMPAGFMAGMRYESHPLK